MNSILISKKISSPFIIIFRIKFLQKNDKLSHALINVFKFKPKQMSFKTLVLKKY